MTFAQILSLLAAAAGTGVLLLYRSLYSRVVTLEGTAYQKADAILVRADLIASIAQHASRDEEQFHAVQMMLKDFRTEIHEQFDALRAENNDKRTEMRNDMINLRSESNAANARIYDLIDRKTQRRSR